MKDILADPAEVICVKKKPRLEVDKIDGKNEKDDDEKDDSLKWAILKPWLCSMPIISVESQIYTLAKNILWFDNLTL